MPYMHLKLSLLFDSKCTPLKMCLSVDSVNILHEEDPLASKSFLSLQVCCLSDMETKETYSISVYSDSSDDVEGYFGWFVEHSVTLNHN